jgi:hypothetical protein
MAVVGIITPGAMVVQVFIADYIPRNILRGGHLVFPLVASDIPLLKIVGAWNRLSVTIHLVRAGEGVLLSEGDGIGLAACGDFA